MHRWSTGSSNSAAMVSDIRLGESDSDKRVVDYTTKVWEGYLKKMVAMRQTSIYYSSPSDDDVQKHASLTPTGATLAGSVFKEVQESISLPTKPRSLRGISKIRTRSFCPLWSKINSGTLSHQ